MHNHWQHIIHINIYKWSSKESENLKCWKNYFLWKSMWYFTRFNELWWNWNAYRAVICWVPQASHQASCLSTVNGFLSPMNTIKLTASFTVNGKLTSLLLCWVPWACHQAYCFSTPMERPFDFWGGGIILPWKQTFLHDFRTMNNCC